MVVTEGPGWSGIGWDDWANLSLIRARLDAGADPDTGVYFHERPLHAAAECGSPEVIAELCQRVGDVDAEHEGRTALWEAVFNNRPGNARALAAAGADPWRPMMNGWSPDASAWPRRPLTCSLLLRGGRSVRRRDRRRSQGQAADHRLGRPGG
ncbi:ankyrin repeat domain-containing protein [Nonomuraea thailandensis]